MVRFYDRLLANGSDAITVRHLMQMADIDHPEEHRRISRDNAIAGLVDRGVGDPTEVQIRAFIDHINTLQRKDVSTDSVAAGWTVLAKAQVIIGDEVGHYLNSFPDGVQLSTLLLTPVVPPFGHVFVDFRRVPNPYHFDQFGWLISTVDHGPDHETEGRSVRWTLYATLYGSWDGRNAVGPIMSARVLLDDDGNLIRIPVDTLDIPAEQRERLANGIPMVTSQFGGDLNFATKLMTPLHDEMVSNTTNASAQTSQENSSNISSRVADLSAATVGLHGWADHQFDCRCCWGGECVLGER